MIDNFFIVVNTLLTRNKTRKLVDHKHAGTKTKATVMKHKVLTNVF